MRPRARVISFGKTSDTTIKLDARGLQPGELAICAVQLGSYALDIDPTDYGFTEVVTINEVPASLRIYEKEWLVTDPDEIVVEFGAADPTAAILFGVFGSASHTYVTGHSAADIPTIPAYTADQPEVSTILGITSANGNRYKLGSVSPTVDLPSDQLDTGRTLAVWLTDGPEDGDTVPARVLSQKHDHTPDNYVGFAILLNAIDPETSMATESYAAFAPAVDAFGDPQGFFKRYMHAIGRMFREAEDIISDQADGTPGFGTSLDIDRAPDSVLPWLAVISGNPNKGGVNLRDHIRRQRSFNRGTVESLVHEIQDHLTGTKTVYVFERQGGAYRMGIAVLGSESPGATILDEVIKANKAAGIIVTLFEIAGGDFDTLTATHSDFADVTATFTDFDDITLDPSQT